ncbi:MAG TPA: hypothetical protein VFI02_15055, partial [Armatimonadota bacterium]|nr:hypothetical protein [Armatimonadota bacterium]
KIEKIDSPADYITVKSETDGPDGSRAGKRYTITASLNGTAPMGLIKGEVVIHTNDKDQSEIKVPLYALIEE